MGMKGRAILGKTVWTICLATLCCLAASRAAAQTTQKLSSGEELELKTLSGQLADPARAAQTKLEAAELLLSKTYPQATDALRGFLSDPLNRPAQIAVAEAIAKHGEERKDFVEPLMAMLTGEEPTVRAAAAKALAMYKNNGVTEKLVEIATDKKRDVTIRLECIASLQRVLDKTAVDALVRLLDDKDPAVVTASLEALTKLTNIRAFGADRLQWRQWWEKNASKPRSEWLVDLADSLAKSKNLLEAENAALRDRLGKAAEMLYLATAVAQRDAMLMSLMKDSLADVRLVGARLMERRLSAPEKLPPEMRTQFRTMLGDPDLRVRRDIALLMNALADPEACKALLERLKIEETPEVRKAALTSLGQLGDPAALPAVLAEIKSRQSDIAAAAASALGRIAAKGPLEKDARANCGGVLIDRYHQIDKAEEMLDLRESLLTAMGSLGGEECIPVFREAVKDNAATLRLAAVNGFRQMGKADLAVAIEPLASDADRGVRQAVIAAMGALGGERNLQIILQRTDPAAESDAAVKQQAWDAAMAILAKGDAKLLATVVASLAKRADAADQRIKIMQMLVSVQRTAKSAELPATLRQLGLELLTAGRPAEAAPMLAEALDSFRASKDAQAAAVWNEWVEALLAADDPAVTKAVADQKDEKVQAEGVKRVLDRIEAAGAKEKWQSVVQLCTGVQNNLAAKLSAAQNAAVEKTLADAKARQVNADRQRVASLVAQLTAADEAARKAAAAEIQGMGDRAAVPLLQELKKVITADGDTVEAEKAIFQILKPLAPKLAGYDPALPKADRIKLLDDSLAG